MSRYFRPDVSVLAKFGQIADSRVTKIVSPPPFSRVVRVTFQSHDTSLDWNAIGIKSKSVGSNRYLLTYSESLVLDKRRR